MVLAGESGGGLEGVGVGEDDALTAGDEGRRGGRIAEEEEREGVEGEGEGEVGGFRGGGGGEDGVGEVPGEGDRAGGAGEREAAAATAAPEEPGTDAKGEGRRVVEAEVDAEGEAEERA